MLIDVDPTVGDVSQTNATQLGTASVAASQVPAVNTAEEMDAPSDSNRPVTMDGTVVDLEKSAADLVKEEWEAKRKEIDEKYRQKLIDAQRKSKPLSARRDEALKFMDEMRDLLRGEDVTLTDDHLDNLIRRIIQGGIFSGLTKIEG
jgi:hypothetical protein